MLPVALLVSVTPVARLPTLLRLIPAPAFTTRLFAPAVPTVSAPEPFTAPPVAAPPVVPKVRFPGVVTALFSVIVPPPVCSTHAPLGFVTPVTAPSVLKVPVCAVSPTVNVPVVVIVLSSAFERPRPEPPVPITIALPAEPELNDTAP